MPFKDRIEQMKENAKYKKIQQHVQDNKVPYIVGITGVSCLAVGGFGGAILGNVDTKLTVDSMKLIHIQYKSPNTNIALVKRACPDPIPVLDKMTGEPYRSIRRAAAATGRNIMDISKDAQGVQERFERLPDSVFA